MCEIRRGEVWGWFDLSKIGKGDITVLNTENAWRENACFSWDETSPFGAQKQAVSKVNVCVHASGWHPKSYHFLMFISRCIGPIANADVCFVDCYRIHPIFLSWLNLIDFLPFLFFVQKFEDFENSFLFCQLRGLSQKGSPLSIKLKWDKGRFRKIIIFYANQGRNPPPFNRVITKEAKTEDLFIF